MSYSAFDPALQLWVASCLAMVFEDTREPRRGRTHHDPDEIHWAAAVFATTLQVPPHLWPADRDAFPRHRDEQLDSLEFDRRTIDLLVGIARLDFLPAPVPAVLGGWSLFMTPGYLPAQLHERLGFTWTPDRQRRFER